VDGLRVTDEATLDAAELVLSGRVNKRITRALQRAGVKAVGVAGTDGGLLSATVRRAVRPGPNGQTLHMDWGRVGDVAAVDTHLLTTLAEAGYVPVVSPLALGPDGDALNVNADSAAAALAAALGAELRLVTNVPGILDAKECIPLPMVTASGVETMKASGVIRDGMVPKVDACLAALRGGAQSAVIQSLAGFISGTAVGTRVVEAEA
jgi:acetylglutamate kinase